MMDNVESALKVLFRRVSVQEILERKLVSDNITCREFVGLMRAYSNQYSDTEYGNLYGYLTDLFEEQHYPSEHKGELRRRLDVFRLLRRYANWILTVQENELVCEYSKFLHWRMVTKELSEDLFTASFFASGQRETAGQFFDWKIAITHNNRELHKILAQGMAENHSHLKGAAPVFPLTWISLMNNIDSRDAAEKLWEIERQRQNVNIQYKLSYKEEPFSTQLLRAACIRFFLFRLVCSELWGIPEPEGLDAYCDFLLDPVMLRFLKGELVSDITAFQYMDAAYGALPDYAIWGFLKENKNGEQRLLALEGERWLLYHMFKAIFWEKPRLYSYKDLFYAYLVIKENFRAEIVQNNDNVGFNNFRIYEQRKDIFIEDPFYTKELVKQAVEASLLESGVSVSEMRIAPRNSADGLYQYITQLDQRIDAKKRYRHRFFYTVHFIKSEETLTDANYVVCRQWANRRRYREEAVALAGFRNQYPVCAKRVKGIDAANMEIGCGPEVFAQVFRYLSDHRVILEWDEHTVVPQLRRTYHVGEDYLDLVSGLRAIDEAVNFLGMKCGDRLGHALALGVDVEEWYKEKGNRILLPQQEYLDNVVWMYHLSVSFHLQNLDNIKNFLRREYEYYFQVIYKNAMEQKMLEHINGLAKEHYKGTEKEAYYGRRSYDFNIDNYYFAWKLRADNPELYKKGFYDDGDMTDNYFKSFSYYAIDRTFLKKQNMRYLQEVALIYYYYHFDRDVRKEGIKPIEKKISLEYIQCVKQIQHELQKRIAWNGIAIETNPSSNYLIGTFKRYDKHPIIRFYNKDLVEDMEKLQECPQISVSINTDDAGIFSTSLENEYGYMALALEKATDGRGNALYKKRNIYEWLDHIRRMGLRQTFLSNEEIKIAMEGQSSNPYMDEQDEKKYFNS